MALDAEETELFDFAVAALPRWFTSDERQREELYGFAKMLGATRATVFYWFGQTLIGAALGPVTGLPDWLNQHAIDRGTRRQASESDVALRQRLRNVPDALTRGALLSATNAILVAEGIVGTAAMVELPRDAGHWGSYVAMSGVGGTFVQVGTTTKFTPSALLWPRPPFKDPSIVPVIGYELVIAGAANAGNDGTRTITGLDGNAAIVTNAGGVAGADPTVTWTAQRMDANGNLTDGWGRFYWGRGFRWSRGKPASFVIILPYGATSGTLSSVAEMLRQKKAAGEVAHVEVRMSP